MKIRCVLVVLIIATTVCMRSSAAQRQAKQQTYKLNEGGLKKLIKDLMGSAEVGDSQPFAMVTWSDSASSFKQMFGEARGVQMASFYEENKLSLAEALSVDLKDASRNRRNDVTVFRSSDVLRKNGFLSALVNLLGSRTEIFRVILNEDSDKEQDIGSFIIADGSFRYLGKLYAIRRGQQDELLWVDPREPFDEPRMVKHGRIRYPEVAKQARIAGTVTLSGVVGQDGAIAQLQVIAGHPLLVPDTLKVVQQWRFRPLMYKGQYLPAALILDSDFRIVY